MLTTFPPRRIEFQSAEYENGGEFRIKDGRLVAKMQPLAKSVSGSNTQPVWIDECGTVTQDADVSC